MRGLPKKRRRDGIKRTCRADRALNLDEAIDLLRRPDCVLVDMKTPNTKFGRQFYVVANGPRVAPCGAVTDDIASKILAHPLCHESDAGLFPGIPQSYSLHFDDEAKRRAHLSRHKRWPETE